METIDWTEENHFSREGDFLYKLNGGKTGIIVMGIESHPDSLEIPAVIAGLPVTAIGEGAFQNNTWLREVRLPETVTTLHEFAFDGCDHLENLNLPDCLRRIEMCALGLTSLRTVNVPAGTEFIGHYAFAQSPWLEEVALPDGLLEMETNPFAGCPRLARIQLKLDHPVFRLRDGLLWDHQRHITICLLPGLRIRECAIPEGIETVGAFTFSENHTLRGVTMPESVRIIEDFTFTDCDQLRSVSLPANLEKIETGAIMGCRRLKALELPPNLKEIEDAAFSGCPFLTLLVRRGSPSWKICRERSFPYRCIPHKAQRSR